MPNMMTRLENLVGEKGFFVGDQVTKIYSHSPNLWLTSMDPIVVKHLSFISFISIKIMAICLFICKKSLKIFMTNGWNNYWYIKIYTLQELQ